MIDTTNKLFTITVYKKLKNNNNGQTKHWSSSAKERKEWMVALENADVLTETGLRLSPREFVSEVLGDTPMACKVGLQINRCMGPRERLWDADSVLRGSAKQLVDSIVEFGLLTDDGPKHIVWALGTQDDVRSDESHVEITFFGA